MLILIFLLLICHLGSVTTEESMVFRRGQFIKQIIFIADNFKKPNTHQVAVLQQLVYGSSFQ